MKLMAPEQEFDIHPAGIFPAVCVDVIDMGERQSTYQGNTRTVRRLRLVFETVTEEGMKEVARSFNASLHSKSALGGFLARWRGKPFVPGEELDTAKLPGVSCTLVLSHQPRQDGQGEYVSIDAISKPSRVVKPSGRYDPIEARRRVEAQKAQAAGEKAAAAVARPAAGPAPGKGQGAGTGMAIEEDGEIAF